MSELSKLKPYKTVSKDVSNQVQYEAGRTNPDLKVDGTKTAMTDITQKNIDCAGMTDTNQAGYKAKKEYQGDHWRINPDDVKNMKIEPLKISGRDLTEKTINTVYDKFMYGYQKQKPDTELMYDKRSLTMSYDNPHGKVYNKPIYGKKDASGYAGYIESEQFYASYITNGGIGEK